MIDSIINNGNFCYFNFHFSQAIVVTIRSTNLTFIYHKTATRFIVGLNGKMLWSYA